MGLVDELGGFDVALREVTKLVPADTRARLQPHVLRAPRQALPILEPPAEGEAGRRAASVLLASLLPASQRIALGLAASGEWVFALWCGEIDGPSGLE